MTGNGKKQKAESRPKAVVCDLCADYAEPNCVRACPHDAALRVEPKTFFAQELAGLQLAVPGQTVRPGAAAPTSPDLSGPVPENMETRILSNVADLLPLLPQLKVLSASRAGSTLQLRFPKTTFGRGAENDYRFADDTQMSRNHCAIEAQNGRFVMRDLESTNGTLVNGNQIGEMELQTGDIIEFGEIQLEFQAGQIQ